MPHKLRYSQLSSKPKLANLEILSELRKSHYVHMETITPEWLRARLDGDRGKKAELAEALGIGADKVSKMISGARKPQAEEIPKILAFFGVTTAQVDPELAEVWRKLEPAERLFLLNAAKAQIAARDQSEKEPGEEPQ